MPRSIPLSKIRFQCQHSKEFKHKTDTFYVERLGHLIAVANDTRRGFHSSAQKSIKSRMTREGLSVEEVFGFVPKTCGFCGRKNMRMSFRLNVDLETRIINVDDVLYEDPQDLYYCFSTPHEREKDTMGECRGKTLNPNSAEFIQVVHNLSTREDALTMIHNRNSSPFYRENHASNEMYSAFQRAQFYGRPAKEVRAGILKIQKTRELNEVGLSMRKSGFSAITREDGHILRSNGERLFYRYAKEIGISEFIETNGFYPDSILCFDFAIPALGMFVEISGLEHEKYLARIAEKQKKFGAVVLKYARSNRFFEQDCKELLNSIKDKLQNAKLQPRPTADPLGAH